ncbi:acyltransferase [Altererythrobacter sp. JGD-16]|uniref:Acyltransferase n=1 Tax=Altererythrobacter lutimaris TaxID=2743979 RepID=A0A850HAL5_9SPHN|nr:acyltransferase [Altererythrobacter lutimaris]
MNALVTMRGLWPSAMTAYKPILLPEQYDKATAQPVTPPAIRAGQRLVTLDLLRGIAAIAVMLRHYPWPGHQVPILPSSFLAVDLFFLLSGYVLAATYEPRLLGNMSAGNFMTRRLTRMYPLYFLGLALALLACLGAVGTHPPAVMSQSEFALAAFFNLFFLPAPPPGLVHETIVTQAFPFNFPAWSLFWELAVNGLYALIILRLTPKMIAAIVGGCFIAMAVFAIGNGTLDSGATWSTFAMGGLRCGFAFFLGVALVRMRSIAVAPKLPSWIPVVLLVSALAVPVSWGPWPALISAAFIFPLAIWLGASAKAGPVEAKISDWLGWISYPVYVLQLPVLMLAGAIMIATTGEFFGDNLARDLAIYCGATVLLSVIAAKLFDEPVRRWLSARMKRS